MKAAPPPPTPPTRLPFNRGSENLNIQPEDREKGAGIEAIFTDPKCLQVQSWLSLRATPDVPTHTYYVIMQTHTFQGEKKAARLVFLSFITLMSKVVNSPLFS